MSNLFRGLNHALIYAKFRPIPPKQLIDSIIDYLSEKIASKEWSKAVDVGCGSGQCTQLLSPYFRQVYGFDVSDAQISQAIHSNHSNHVFYKVSSAENIPDIENSSVQLLTASQAVHWFDLPKFYAEANRVLTSGGVLAIFGYKMPYVSHPDFPNDDKLSSLVNTFYKSPLLLWSKKERQLVDEGYASITLPFPNYVRKDGFVRDSIASAEELKGYLMSWSGFTTLQNTDKQKADQFLSSYDQKIKSIFGDKDFNDIEFNIHFNFFLIMGSKPVF